MAEGKFIAYYRVSTNKQGINGLGIDAQRETVNNFLNGGNWKVIDEFTEVESGQKANRPELTKAIKTCNLKGAKLVVAKLDRLSRDLHFITSLQKANIKFVVAEMPEMNELTIHLMAAMAQHERQMISQRTKQALAQARKRGIVLGNPCLRMGKQIEGSGDTSKARKARKYLADNYAYQMKDIVFGLMTDGISSLNGIANELNRQDYKTRFGKAWTATAVKRLVERIC